MTEKSLNFNCKEVLPALLDRSKTQTIRKAYDIVHFSRESGCNWGTDPNYVPRLRSTSTELIEKPAKFEVGDKVKLYWKKNSKFNGFCRICGNGTSHIKPTGRLFHICQYCVDNTIPFEKCLGEVEITRVHKIEIDKEFIERHMSDPLSILSKVEGFKSTIEMFMYFDKSYDLSTPKQFWVYEWRYL